MFDFFSFSYIFTRLNERGEKFRYNFIISINKYNDMRIINNEKSENFKEVKRFYGIITMNNWIPLVNGVLFFNYKRRNLGFARKIDFQIQNSNTRIHFMFLRQGVHIFFSIFSLEKTLVKTMRTVKSTNPILFSVQSQSIWWSILKTKSHVAATSGIF